MLDVKTLQRHHLNMLAAFYGHAKFLYGSRLQKDSFWAQKRAKKRICKYQTASISKMPEAVREYFLPETDEKVLFDFLTVCYEENSRRMAEHAKKQERILKPLGEEVVRIVQDIQDLWDEDGEAATICLEEENVVILAADDAAFIRRMTLENVILSPEAAGRGYLLSIDEVKQEDDWYIFYEEEDFVQREAVRFTNAHVQIQSIDCTKNVSFSGNAWLYLYANANAILRKSELPGDYCNEQEKALLPLLQEIKQFGTLTEYPLLTALAEQTGCRSAYFDKRLEKTKGKPYAIWNSGLDRAEFEPLLRAIYEKICQSQEGYPFDTELRCDQRMLAEKRGAITEFFYSQGFVGEYPDFSKTTDIPGYHLAPGHHGNVLYCRAKNVQMFICCVESCAGAGEMWVHFLCGRALTGKRSPVQDIFSCRFQDKGYRWSGTVWEHALDHTMEGAAMAVKKVQLQKLSKEERKRYGNYNVGMDKGSKIALAMPAITLPATLLLVTIIGAVSGEWEEVRKMMAEFPWWEVLAVYAAIYGLPFGVFALVARRR